MTARRPCSSETRLIQVIQKLSSREARSASRMKLSIGDDAAVLCPSPGRLTLISSDAMVEGVHFDLRYFRPQDLGWKSLAANLSDIAAMGGKPLCFTTSIALPGPNNLRFVEQLYRGMMDLARLYGVELVGGDTCASPRDVFLDITILGEVRSSELVTRQGARPGDSVFLSGELGGSAMGMELLKSRRFSRRGTASLIGRHLRPMPRCELGRWLARRRLVSAMIDLSDGLSTDLQRICEASRVGAVIEAAAVPVASIPARHSALLPRSTLHYAFHGGEDYELLFTVPAKVKDRIPSRLGGVKLHEVGVITEETGRCRVRRKDRLSLLPPGGFDHFPSY